MSSLQSGEALFLSCDLLELSCLQFFGGVFHQVDDSKTEESLEDLFSSSSLLDSVLLTSLDAFLGTVELPVGESVCLATVAATVFAEVLEVLFDADFEIHTASCELSLGLTAQFTFSAVLVHSTVRGQDTQSAETSLVLSRLIASVLEFVDFASVLAILVAELDLFQLRGCTLLAWGAWFLADDPLLRVVVVVLEAKVLLTLALVAFSSTVNIVVHELLVSRALDETVLQLVICFTSGAQTASEGSASVLAHSFAVFSVSGTKFVIVRHHLINSS